MISPARAGRVLAAVSLAAISLILALGPATPPARAAGPTPSIEEVRQWVRDQGYNYTVAENWVTRLSPEEQEALCGFRPLEAPQEPPSGNLTAYDLVPEEETQGLGASLPPSYDAMKEGYVTPVRDQDGCGSCWIFATVADLESDVAIGESAFYDFSEQEIGDCNIWTSQGNYNFCEGGRAEMAINCLTKYGAADESCHPYTAAEGSCLDCPPVRNVNNWRIITGGNGDSPSKVPVIKNAILEYGPVFSSIYASDTGFLYYDSGVYVYSGSQPPNHAVEIIGWDDTKGAWLIKNSWGTGWGKHGPHPGCAWVAYGSANLGDYTSAIADYGEAGDTIYYHDECGCAWGAYGYYNPTAYGAVRFTPAQDSTLTAVDFWAVDAGMSYEIKIFDTLNYSGGYYSFRDPLGSTQSGSTQEAGYYSIPLDTPVALTEGDDFIVQVKFTNADGHPVPIDYYNISWLPDWSDIATFSGESYFSSGGTQFVKPLYAGNYVDVGIRARAEQSPQPDLVISTSVELTGGNFTVSYNVTNTGTAAANASSTDLSIDGGLQESQPCPALDPGESHGGSFATQVCPCGGTPDVTVCADSEGAVAESDEGNNCRTDILDCPGPDLVITGKWEQWLDPEAKTYSISYTVTNQGCAAGASNAVITIDGVDVLEDPVPTLAAGSSYNNTVGPFTMSGDSDNVTVCADSGDVVAESNETNNCGTNTLHCPPDLVITAKSEPWVDPEAKTYNISYTVTNQGCVTAGASNTTITIDGTDVLEDPVPPLAAHASYNNTVGPYVMSGDSDNVTVCADSGDAVAESDEANNCLTNTLAGPDISIAPTGFNVTMPPNTTQDYTMIIGNDGEGELSYDMSDGDCPWLTESPTSGTVSPGASQNITVTIDTTGLAAGNYTAQIVIASNDPDEDPAPVPVALHVELPLTGYNITLAAGWNLVSLPLMPDNTGIADVPADISGDLAIVWGYNASTDTDTWLWYVPGNPLSTLTAAAEGEGYWFFMNGTAALEGSGREIPGQGASPPAYDVFAGWNLIGFSSTTGMSPETYLASIAGNYSIVWGWDAGAPSWLWYVPDNPLSTLITMEPGCGYWLWATADGIIVPPA
jgi:C1A family cysteine protease/archaellum component FlaF (FlaF/FlaG flagellin family)